MSCVDRERVFWWNEAKKIAYRDGLSSKADLLRIFHEISPY